MNTFDQILPIVGIILAKYRGAPLEALGEVLLNRDLNSRLRLIVSDSLRDNTTAVETLENIASDLLNNFGNRAIRLIVRYYSSPT